MSPEFLAAVDALSLATTALFNWDEPSERLTRADAERLRKLAAAAEEADADGGDEDLLADACTAIAQLVDLSGRVVIVYDVDHLPETGWRDYRKVALTPMVSIVGPCTVVTREGSYELPADWYGFLAIDAGGTPYPIEAAEHARVYERVEP